MTICSEMLGQRLHTQLVLDAGSFLGEAVVSCPHCNSIYLIELLDILRNQRAYRLVPLTAEAAHHHWVGVDLY